MVGADRGGYLLCGAYFPEVCAGCRLQAAGSPFPVLSGDPNCHDRPLDCPSVRVGTRLRSAGGGAGRKRRFCQLPPFVGPCPLGLTDAWGAWPEERAMQAAVGARSARIVGVVL